jgi:hypothetical protein
MGLEFRADDNCKLGSTYRMGVGCDETHFINQYDLVEDETQTKTRNTMKTTMKYFKSTSASDLMKMTSHRNSFSG